MSACKKAAVELVGGNHGSQPVRRLQLSRSEAIMALSKESQWVESLPPIERSSGHFHDCHYPSLIEQQQRLPTKTSELNHLTTPACRRLQILLGKRMNGLNPPGELMDSNFTAISMARVKTCFMHNSGSELREGVTFMRSLTETTMGASLGRLVE
jgi:hypothetical protein